MRAFFFETIRCAPLSAQPLLRRRYELQTDQIAGVKPTDSNTVMAASVWR